MKEKRPSVAVADCRMSADCLEGLSRLGYEIIMLPPSPFLAEPVASHPDMLIFIGKGALVCERRYYETNSDTLKRIANVGGLRLILTEEELSPSYPGDVLFNAAPVGDMLICRTVSASMAVKGLYTSDRIINTKQGYAKCSSLTVGDSGVVTADPSIAKAAKAAGLDVLRLSGSGVSLSGYNEGFIGGASGDDGKRILFCGSLSSHPEGESVAEFCRRHGREPISLCNRELYDYGSLLFV